MITIGEVDDLIINNLSINLPKGKIGQSSGLEKHLISRNRGDLVPLLGDLSRLIKNPTYIGSNTRHQNSFELIIKMDDNILIAIKLDIQESQYYVASVYPITDSKLSTNVNNGRYKPFIRKSR